jgi:hypothetical protein
MGKVPFNLISPNLLREILKNVSMVLPEGYEFIMALRPNNIILYYDVKVAVLADLNSFKLVMDVLLKTSNRYFELYRMVVFPTRISNKGFLKFGVDKDYLAINLL